MGPVALSAEESSSQILSDIELMPVVIVRTNKGAYEE